MNELDKLNQTMQRIAAKDRRLNNYLYIATALLMVLIVVAVINNT